MREVFGDGRVVAAKDGGFAIEAPGLHAPALLLPATNGSPVPDMAPYLDKVISYTGLLRSSGENLESVAIHFSDLHGAGEAELLPSPMWAVVSGNLGKAPEANPKGDRIVASIVYDKVGEAASWLRISAYSYFSISDLFAGLEGGTGVVAYGALESYEYNGKPRLQLALRGLQLLTRSSGPKPPTVIGSARSAADIAAHAFDDA
jgi:hypothetical protein